MSLVLCIVFFISGASALVFETLWFIQAGLAFGNSVWASSLVLTGFMGGLALGSAVAVRRGDRMGPPIRTYAALEVVIAVSGVSLVFLLPSMGTITTPLLKPFFEVPLILNLLRLLFAFMLLLVPSTAMGLTLPLLTKALVMADPNFGRVLGRLYGWNTLGAVLGEGLRKIGAAPGARAHKEVGVMWNTMYAEGGGPVIETPLSVVESIGYMLIQSWGDAIRVFPAMPKRWPDAVFHDLRTEGAFLVSAEWRDGATQWIRIESLAGEPLVLQTDMKRFRVNGKTQPAIKAMEGPRGRKRWKIDLKEGQPVLLQRDD